jgi:hypothetical protein
LRISTQSKEPRAAVRGAMARYHALLSPEMSRSTTVALTAPSRTNMSRASSAWTEWPRRAASRIIAMLESLYGFNAGRGSTTNASFIRSPP